MSDPLLINLDPGMMEGAKWAVCQRWISQACINAGIPAPVSAYLTNIDPGDTEGIKWCKLQAWLALLANNISGGGGGGSPSGPAGGVLGGTYPNPSFSTSTGSGSVVLSISPSLTTPFLSECTVSTINGIAITNGTGTLTLGSATLNAGTGGTLGSNAFTSTAYTQASIVPNTAPAASQILVGNAGGTAYAPVTVSGDSTMTSAGVMTNTAINGTALSGLATGILKNTTTTGVPTIAVSGTDYLAPGNSPTLTGTWLFNAVTPIQIASTSTNGIQIYDTADQVTNYELLELKYASNVATIQTRSGGTGTTTDINLLVLDTSGGGNGMTIYSRGSSTCIAFGSANRSQANQIFCQIPGSGSCTQTSGSNSILAVTPIYNQASGTAANTDILINRTETAIGSGNQYFMDMQVATVSKAHIDHTGVAALGGLSLTLATYKGTVVLASGAGTITSAAITTASTIVLTLVTASGTNSYPQVTAGSGSATVAGLATDSGTYNWRLIN